MARHGQLPAVRVAGKDLTRPAAESGERARPVLVVRLDATLVEAASPKARAAGTYKQGFGFHPLTARCSNVGDSLAVMLRPGKRSQINYFSRFGRVVSSSGEAVTV